MSTAETAYLSSRLGLELNPAGIDQLRRLAGNLHQDHNPAVRNLVDGVLALLHDYHLVRAEALRATTTTEEDRP